LGKIVFFTLYIVYITFFSACSQEVTIRSLEPARIDRISTTKKIIVRKFTNDKVGLSSKIESLLASFTIDGKKYFTIVSRRDFDKIIEEQKLQYSGIVDMDTVVEVGELVGAEAIVSGDVDRVSSSLTRYYKTKTKCADKKCEKTIKYKVGCVKKIVKLSAYVRISDITKGDIIVSDTLSGSKSYSHCYDDSRAMPSTSMVAREIADSMARKFTYKLTPHYRNFTVTLLDTPDLDYTDKQEELLEVALEYIEQKRYAKAQKLLKRLVDSTDSQSYVPVYNLGVISEVKGKYKEAKEYYSYADDLMIQPVDEINSAVFRIDRLIKKHDITIKQISR